MNKLTWAVNATNIANKWSNEELRQVALIRISGNMEWWNMLKWFDLNHVTRKQALPSNAYLLIRHGMNGSTCTSRNVTPWGNECHSLNGNTETKQFASLQEDKKPCSLIYYKLIKVHLHVHYLWMMQLNNGHVWILGDKFKWRHERSRRVICCALDPWVHNDPLLIMDAKQAWPMCYCTGWTCSLGCSLSLLHLRLKICGCYSITFLYWTPLLF